MATVSLPSAASTPAVPIAEIGFTELPRSTQVAVGLVGAAALAITAFAMTRAAGRPLEIAAALLALSMLASLSRLSVPLAGTGSTLSLTYVVNLLSILFVGPWFSAPIAAAGALGGFRFRKAGGTPGYLTVFRMSSLAITVMASGLLYDGLLVLLPSTFWARLGAGAAAATAYLLVNTGLVGSVVAVSTHDPRRFIWNRTVLLSAPSYYVGAALAVVTAEIARDGRQWWVLIFTVPAYLAFRSFRAYTDRVSEEQRQVRELSDVQLAMIEALALAIEAKDATSHDHLQRMQTYAEGLARALGMPEPEVRGVRTAALLHDIGNLAVPEHILTKPTRLNYDEYERLKIHPRVGAEIIRSVPFPYPVAPLVLAHHERWDGRGYPSGLKGEDIPLGARIIAVVDCFTSMLMDRPYRPSRTYAEAIATLRENGGSGLDPTLVERFIEILPALESRMHADRMARMAVPAGQRLITQDVPAGALADIAVAHREEHMLRDIAHSLSSSLRVSDTLALISTRLVSMLPLDSCALFLVDPASELFLCSHVVGANQDALRAVTAASLESLGNTLPPSPSPSPGTGPAAVRLQSVLVCGLETENGTIGALAVYHQDRAVYSADHRRLLSRVAAHAAKVIANAVVFEQTQEQSLTDVLTGLPNRRYLDRQLAQELARVQRHGGRVSVLVLDMDGFKQINDEFGHQAGDRALKEVAHTLRATLRVYDLCARFAGDEFVVVLGDCDTSQAERRRVELQQAIAALWVEPVPGRIVPLSVSVGAATFPDDADTTDGVIAVADRRMYRDKASHKLLTANHDAVTPDYLWK